MSVMSLLNRVKEGEIVLPNIQREFVWPEESITKLMDSVMRGYPIGIVLMWETYDNIQYRTFTSSYVEESVFDYDSSNNRKLLLVLDGQQRLQSLFIALYGKYYGKSLYFELLSGQEQNDSAEIKYEFQFLTDDEAERLNNDSIEKFSDPESDDPSTDHEKWYYAKVSNLFEMGFDDIENLTEDLAGKINLDQSERITVRRNIGYLKQNLQENQHVLKYSTLDENKPSTARDRKTASDILEVFVRVNREGTRLSKSDLIFSMLKLNWKDSAVDLPRFVEELNSNTNFDFDKDFVIKCLFAVSDFGPKYDIDVLRKKSNIDIIKKNYDDCCNAIRSCIDFVRQHCWINSDRVLPGYNVLIPFVYYLFHLPNHVFPEKDIANLRKFFYISGFTKLFTRYAESRIKIYLRDYLKPQFDEGVFDFSFEGAMKLLKRYESFNGLNDDVLNDSLHLVLNLIQGNFDMNLLYDRNDPEIDHIFPKSTLKNKGCEDHDINSYANYWYLPKNQNRNKSNKHPKRFFEDIGMTHKKLLKLFISPDLLDFRRYSTFLNDRGGKIRNYVSKQLDIKESDYVDDSKDRN